MNDWKIETYKKKIENKHTTIKIIQKNAKYPYNCAFFYPPQKSNPQFSAPKKTWKTIKHNIRRKILAQKPVGTLWGKAN